MRLKGFPTCVELEELVFSMSVSVFLHHLFSCHSLSLSLSPSLFLYLYLSLPIYLSVSPHPVPYRSSLSSLLFLPFSESLAFLWLSNSTLSSSFWVLSGFLSSSASLSWLLTLRFSPRIITPYGGVCQTSEREIRERETAARRRAADQDCSSFFSLPMGSHVANSTRAP